MEDKTKYFVLKKKAVPEVLLKVVEAKKLIESGRAESVQEATDSVGISRSSFYKYKDDIFPFHDNAKGKTITMVIQMDDEPGLLSLVLQIGRFPCEYSHNPSEYSGQRNCLSYAERRRTARHEECVLHGREHRAAGGRTLFKNISQGVTL